MSETTKTKTVDGVTLRARYVRAPSWQRSGFMVDVVDGPSCLLMRDTADAALADGFGYVSRNWERTAAGWRPIGWNS